MCLSDCVTGLQIWGRSGNLLTSWATGLTTGDLLTSCAEQNPPKSTTAPSRGSRKQFRGILPFRHRFGCFDSRGARNFGGVFCPPGAVFWVFLTRAERDKNWGGMSASWHRFFGFSLHFPDPR